MHTLVWGAQYPGWLTSLSQADQRAEIEEWMQAVASRYPNIWAIDVVNEPVKTASPFKDSLGGNGSTGWDWVITSFQLARQYFPGKKLLINEYGTENDASARNTYKTIINLLKSRGLIDGIGVQAHFFNLDNMSASQMTTCLNDYATLSLDVYISELDIKGGGTESGQSSKYQQLFPVMWNHSSVKGITLWGYIEGQTWSSGTGILRSNGTEKPAMTWLKSFMGGGGGSNTIVVRARGTSGSESIQLRVNNSTIATWTLTTSMANYTATTSSTGALL
jgi:endo-1,4-beta-xylanase